MLSNVRKYVKPKPISRQNKKLTQQYKGEKSSSSPRAASVCVSPSVIPSVRVKRGMQSKRVFTRKFHRLAFWGITQELVVFPHRTQKFPICLEYENTFFSRGDENQGVHVEFSVHHHPLQIPIPMQEKKIRIQQENSYEIT